ncbi:hypothetical protein FisN_4Lh505 [Fistulifera solaris]|uniref:RING-type domain-containing protein n=1 Tax=Fistulifera solaris TaxID=1519565 RepID=A0A1Z5KDL5_FISSO|nr:hypothetical protein FisN_4Lh505 [Fistulifera solaris]|eukprot:GAX24384.1 hypothetical protein FisN_4Lh505 [Fistulifera solaris]
MLIVYEEEPRYMGYFLLLKPDEENAPKELNEISLTYLPFLELQEFARRMDEFASGESVFFLHPGNEQWSFVHSIVGEWEPVGVDSDDRNARSDDYYGQDDYDWIRYTLFSLLLVSPCIRAIYLFYAGGGRLHFRRNDLGRVVGLQYIPPMPYWLSHGRPPRPVTPSSETLTLAQFNELPQIIYEAVPVEGDVIVAPDDGHDDGSDKAVDPRATEDDLELGSNDKVASSTISPVMESELILTPPQPSNEDVVQSGADSVQNESPLPVISTLKTICTECSICIDDFEVGERLTLLPRCRHAFHNDCIRPWLLERQGCCPLCKMSVLVEGNVTNDSEQDTDSSLVLATVINAAAR